MKPVAIDMPRRSARIANVERLRMLAIFDIIGFHAGRERTLFLGGIGLATFLLLTHLFNCTVSNKLGLTPFAKIKIHRLLWPWLFWCAIYGICLMLYAYRHDRPIASQFTSWMLLYGTRVHLWFVPFALVSGIAVGWIQNATANRPDHLIIAGSAVLGGLVLLACAIATNHIADLPVPIPQYIYALASPFIGFAIGRAVLVREPSEKRRIFMWLTVGATTYAAAFLVLVQFVPMHYMGLRYTVMTIVIIGAIAWPGRVDSVTRLAIPLMFGVYLIHPLIIDFLYPFDMLHRHVFLYTILVFLISNLVIWLMRRTPLRRFT
jgi:surface polysaccharide O-acyltransferase-like enzyme